MVVIMLWSSDIRNLVKNVDNFWFRLFRWHISSEHRSHNLIYEAWPVLCLVSSQKWAEKSENIRCLRKMVMRWENSKVQTYQNQTENRAPPGICAFFGQTNSMIAVMVLMVVTMHIKLWLCVFYALVLFTTGCHGKHQDGYVHNLKIHCD